VLISDLSLPIRHLTGDDPPKQLLAVAGKALFGHIRRLLRAPIALRLAPSPEKLSAA
jgi:hypothetical protein